MLLSQNGMQAVHWSCGLRKRYRDSTTKMSTVSVDLVYINSNEGVFSEISSLISLNQFELRKYSTH